MALFKNFEMGINTYGDAHKLIIKHNLWAYVFFPGVINLMLFILVFVLGYYTGRLVTDNVFYWLGISKDAEGIFKFLAIFLHFFLRIFVYLLLFVIYLSSYKYIVLMIMSPFLAVLSEKTDTLITGKKYNFIFKQFLKDIFRGVCIVLRNLLIELGFLIILFFLGFIPVIGFVCPLIAFVISMYYYGFSMIDYSNERYKLSVSKSVKFVRKNKGFAIANGMIFYLLLMIPILGMLVAPSYSVVAATIGVEKIKQNELQSIKNN